MIRLEDLNVSLLNFNLRDIHLTVAENEFFALMGPTGAGKTVLLEAIAGLVPVKSGRIFIGEREVTGLPPERRGIGIVYQDHALFPHQTVLQNITYGLHFHKAQRTEAQDRREHLIELLQLSHLLDRLPTHLSGGEKQRVALARALMVAPEVLLLDEPLSALDPNFREEVRDALKELHKTSKAAFLMVTHDFSDALFLAERAAVMNQGRLEQIGVTEEIFRRPTSFFAAEFVGMKNIFPATFDGAMARIGELTIEMGAAPKGSMRYLSVRPEDVVISREPTSRNGATVFQGEIKRVVDHGFYLSVSIKTGGLVFQSVMPKNAFLDADPRNWTAVYVQVRPSSLHTF
ncbi:MAG: ABC transporter ATP-binding protein [Candidatus Desulfacyla sp.]